MSANLKKFLGLTLLLGLLNKKETTGYWSTSSVGSVMSQNKYQMIPSSSIVLITPEQRQKQILKNMQVSEFGLSYDFVKELLTKG